MSLTFPNPSRSLDSTGQGVDFWGYDGLNEISFNIELDAFRKLPSAPNNTQDNFLISFDNAKKQIYQVAAQQYTNSRRHLNIYLLTANDF